MARDKLSQRWIRIERRSKARRARRGVRSMAALRVAELNRLFERRWGARLPDDDAGRDDARIMAHHLAGLRGNDRRIAEWLEIWAPWMPATDAEALATAALSKPLRWRADTLGKLLNLSRAERDSLRIRTIGDIESTAAERRAARQERARLRKEARRRAAGSTQRQQYEVSSVSRTKPWIALDISRRTWYRLGKPSAGTSPAPL